MIELLNISIKLKNKKFFTDLKNDIDNFMKREFKKIFISPTWSKAMIIDDKPDDCMIRCSDLMNEKKK